MPDTYFDVVRYRDPTFSPDGRLSVVRRHRDGSSIVAFEKGGGTARELLASDDQVLGHGWLPPDRIWYTDGSEIAYVDVGAEADESGSERRQGPDESVPERRQVADGALVHELLPDASHDRIAALVTTRGRYQRGRSVRAYVDGDGTPAATVPADAYTEPVAWHPERNWLVLKRVYGTFAHELVRLDCETGEADPITDGSEARYTSIGWGPDGDRLYLVTDYEADTLYGAVLDPEDGTPEPLVRDRAWNVESLALHDSGRLLYVVNRGGESRVFLGRLDGTRGVLTRRIEGLPEGVATQAAFDDSGDRLALVVITEASPSILCRVDADSRTVECQRRSERVPWAGDSAGTPGISRERRSFVVHYEAHDGRRIPALVSEPTSDCRPRTAVVDVHGGPEVQRRPSYRPRIRWLLDRGFPVVEPNVRGSTGYGREFAALDDGPGRRDAVADVAALGRWLRSTWDLDSVVLCGESHGGLLALVNAYAYPDQWDAVVSSAGIYDLESFVRSVERENRSLREAEYGSPDEQGALFEELSPLEHAEAVDVPVLVVHGRADRKVPPEGASEFTERVRAAGTDAETLLVDGEGHTFSDLENIRRELETTEAFLERILGSNEPV